MFVRMHRNQYKFCSINGKKHSVALLSFQSSYFILLHFAIYSKFIIRSLFALFTHFLKPALHITHSAITSSPSSIMQAVHPCAWLFCLPSSWDLGRTVEAHFHKSFRPYYEASERWAVIHNHYMLPPYVDSGIFLDSGGADLQKHI